MLTNLSVRGAREHNLKNVDVDIPRETLTVITGLSGSGKSSLAFDTLYAEGQRRYVESLSAYARQFLGQMEKPDVDSIDGLSPAIAIEQRSAGSNPRSTVATITEIYDYLRLLFARLGVQHCPSCGTRMERQSVQEMVDTLAARHGGDDFDCGNAGQVEAMARLRVRQGLDPGTAGLLGVALHQRTTIQKVHRHYPRSSMIVSDNGVPWTWIRMRCR